MRMEPWCNDTHRRNPKYWEKNLSQCHFVYHKSHKDLPEIYSGLREGEAGN